MDPFSDIIVLTSIVLGLGVIRLVGGLIAVFFLVCNLIFVGATALTDQSVAGAALH